MDTNMSIRAEHYHFIKIGGAVLALVVLFGAAAVTITIFMQKYAEQFYKNISNGQNDLCNFYTCSVEDDQCGFFPFTENEKGEKICLTD